MSESAVEVREVVKLFGDNVVVTAVVVLMLIPIIVAARLGRPLGLRVEFR